MNPYRHLLAALLVAGAPLALAEHKPPLEAVRFIAIGDMGSGYPGQFSVAAKIKEVCQVRECQFALAMGDNIYENGVTSENDQLFVDVFELPYQHLGFPFYFTLGNHDNSSSIGLGETNSRGDFQIDYYYRQDRSDSYVWNGTNPSAKWILPDRYYRFVKGREPIVVGQHTVGGQTEPVYDYLPLVEFISLDANPIATPSDPTYDPTDYARDHGRWLERVLKDSNARWQIAFHHQPYVSNGEHGNAGSYNDVPGEAPSEMFPPGRDPYGHNFKAFYEEYACGNGLDVAFQGHDHDLQILPPPTGCPETLFVLSGAGGKVRGPGDQENPALFEKYCHFGFMWVEITDREMNIQVYGQEATDCADDLEPAGEFEELGYYTFTAPER